jgi:hypothetical protein
MGELSYWRKELPKNELQGIYIVKYDNCIEILQLLPDGKYIQMLSLNGQQIRTVNEGEKWSTSFNKGFFEYNLLNLAK